MYFLYSLGGVTFNKCWITLSILNCYSPNFQGFILMKNALNNEVGMLGDMFIVFMACSKLEARGHLLHKTGTPPKQISRECTYMGFASALFLVIIVLQNCLPMLQNSMFTKKCNASFLFVCGIRNLWRSWMIPNWCYIWYMSLSNPVVHVHFLSFDLNLSQICRAYM